MEPEPTARYRKRVEEAPGGLTRERDERSRPSVHGLTLDALDVQAASLELVPLTAQLAMEDDFDSAAQDALPDFGLGTLLAREKTDRCRQLMERAQEMIAGGQTRGALGVVAKAVTADPSSGEAWALKGRCLAELGHHEAAVRVLRQSRERVVEPAMRIAILKLESECVRATIAALETQLIKLVEAHKLDEALTLVEGGLARQPSNIVLLHHLANLKWARGEKAAAWSAVEEARRHVGRENVDLIAELERKIGFEGHRVTVESARQALRCGDTAAALKQLNTCRTALEGNEHYDGLYALAESKRRGGLSQLMASRAPAPNGAQHQQTLRWLISEELKAEDEALRQGDFRAARQAFEAGARIAPECAAVNYRHAAAIVTQDGLAIQNARTAHTGSMLEDLKQAEELANLAAVDASHREDRKKPV